MKDCKYFKKIVNGNVKWVVRAAFDTTYLDENVVEISESEYNALRQTFYDSFDSDAPLMQ